MDGRRDRWALGCVLLLIVALLPFLAAAWVVLTSFQLLAWIFGAGLIGIGGGCGLLGSLIVHHLLERALRRPEPIPVYHHVIDRDDGRQELVRQELEFRSGKIFVGNRVRLQGRRRAGIFVVEGGRNETLDAVLVCPRSGWRTMFLMLLAVTAAEYTGIGLLFATVFSGSWWTWLW